MSPTEMFDQLSIRHHLTADTTPIALSNVTTLSITKLKSGMLNGAIFLPHLLLIVLVNNLYNCFLYYYMHQ